MNVAEDFDWRGNAHKRRLLTHNVCVYVRACVCMCVCV